MRNREVRYDYIIGCKTWEMAQESLRDEFATAGCFESDKPKIVGYYIKGAENKKRKRYKVTLKLCDI